MLSKQQAEKQLNQLFPSVRLEEKQWQIDIYDDRGRAVSVRTIRMCYAWVKGVIKSIGKDWESLVAYVKG